MSAANAWSAEQRRLLAGLGVTLFARVEATPEPVVDADSAFAGLRAALERAAGGRNLAALLLDLRQVRASGAAKRALWPALRALRRGG